MIILLSRIIPLDLEPVIHSYVMGAPEPPAQSRSSRRKRAKFNC